MIGCDPSIQTVMDMQTADPLLMENMIIAEMANGLWAVRKPSGSLCIAGT